MGLVQLQNNFTRGELDPRLAARNDLESYYDGMSIGSDVLALVQGGVRSRPGQAYIGEALGNGRLERFAFNVEQQYLLVFTNLKIQVYKNGVLLPTVNGGNNYIPTPYSLADTQEFDFIQSADTGLITHEDHAPQVLVRLSETNWTFGAATITNTPQYDYNDALSPTPVSEVQDVAFTDYISGDRFKISLDGILTEEIIYADTDSATAENIRKGVQDMPNTANTGVGVTVNGPDDFRITLSGSSASNWELMTVTPVYTNKSTALAVFSNVTNGTSRVRGCVVCRARLPKDMRISPS
jgi:hypothetical protein